MMMMMSSPTSTPSGSSTSGEETMRLMSSGSPSFMVLPCYRRMTPEEDLIATLQGIHMLVDQRRQLVDQLIHHYKHLKRSNEIDALLSFSRDIDCIMSNHFRIRGLNVLHSANSATGPSAIQSHNEAKVRRGVTIQWQDFQPRSFEPQSGIRSLRRVLEIEKLRAFSQKLPQPKKSSSDH